MIKSLKRNYFHSFTQRPSFNIFTHLQINYTIDSLERIKTIFNTTDYYFPIVVISAGIRLLQIPSVFLLQKLSLYLKLRRINRLSRDTENYNIKKIEGNTYPTIIKKVFINDLKIDIKQRKLTNLEYRYYKEYYSIETIGSYMIQACLVLTNLKSISILESIIGKSSIVMIPHSIFTLVFLSNYLFLKYSKHPWLINLNNNKIVNISFVFSLLSLFFSKYACISWVAYNLTHFIISYFNYSILKSNIANKSLRNYYQSKANDMSNLLNK